MTACHDDDFTATARPRRRRDASRVVLTGRGAQAIETGRTRLLITGLVFALAFLVIGGRLVDLVLFNAAAEARVARAPLPERLETGRADIVDRNGVVLATSLPTASLYADAREVLHPREAAAALSRILPDLAHEDVLAKLTSGRSFVWLKRNLTPREQYAVNSLGLPGLDFQREMRRVYPQGALTAHAVGYTDVDGNGLAGLEGSLDSALRGSAEPLRSSLDVRVQHVVARELAAATAEFQGIGAAALVMDARTSEILSLVSLPTYDPNDKRPVAEEQRFNRASLGIYELGSVFKIFTTAMVLDAGLMQLGDGYDTSKPIREARYTIRDYKPKNRWLSVPEIFMYSSNIGTVHMALQAGEQVQRDFLDRLGLLDAPTLELTEVGAPQLPHPWRRINMMTVAYGHGISVSPVQMTNAVAAIVNGGEWRAPTLLRRASGERPAARRVIAPETSRQVRALMRLVVERGTGRKADVPNLLVGGKTGTADKAVNGRYQRGKRIASFVGAFPMNDPRYVIFAMVDEPQGLKRTYGYATGGWVAAPVVGRIAEAIAPMLGVAPVETLPAQDPGSLQWIRTMARTEQLASN